MRVRQINLRKLWLSLLLLVGATAIAVPGIQEIAEGDVAEINGTGYATLQEAFNAAQDGETVTLLENINLTEGVTNTSNAVLNLNGKDITGTVNGKLITNNGTLTIQGTGHIYNQDISAQGHDAIYNTGTLTINGGVYGDADDDQNNANALNRGAAIRNYGGTATINGGSFTACDNFTNSGYAYALINDNDGTMTINDATVYGKNNGNIANNFGTVTIKDGTYTLNNAGSYYSLYIDGEKGVAKTIVEGGTFNNTSNNGLLHTDDASNASLEISGGSFTYTKLTNKNASNVAVSGGTFSSAIPEAFCAEGCTIVDNGNGTYSVSSPSYVAKIGDVKYETLADAFAAAHSGETILLLANLENIGSVSLPAGVTLDGDGKNITGNSAIKINANGGTVQNVNFKNIHNNNSRLSAIYGTNLAGTATITGCSFDNCDWDAIQIEPVANANVVITNNSFSDDESDGVKQQRYIHVQSKTNVDFSATITENVMPGKLKQEPLGVYYPTDKSKVNLTKNYIESINDVCILVADDNGYAGELVFPAYKTAEKQETYSPVAMIQNGAYAANFYETLQSAIDAAETGATINILKDYTLTTVTTNPNNKYNVNINKSVTINGDGHTITSSEGKRALALTGDGNNITLKNLTVVNNKSDWCVGILNNPTVTLDATTIDGSGYNNGYNQPLTIGGEGAGGVKLYVTNGSVIKTNNEGTAHYSITVWRPSEIKVTDSKLIGWAGIYLKPAAAGSTVKIEGSEIVSKGIAGYNSRNSFAAIVSEGNDIEIEIKDTKINTTPAEDTYESLFVITGSNNVVKILGTTKYETTDMTLGAVTSNPSALFNNKVYFDDETKAAFAKYFTDEVGPAIANEKEEPISLYPLVYAPEVYYYWEVQGGYAGVYTNFAYPFEKTEEFILGDGEYIKLMKDITLDHNIVNPLASGTINLLLDNYTITKGDYSLQLKEGQSFKTDKQTNIFSAVDAGFKVVETAVEGGYTYTVVAKEYVAQIGDEQQYYSLAEAFEAVQDGQTITVLTDIDLPSTIAVTKQVTLDLDGKTISNTSDLWGGDNWSFFSVRANGNLTVTGNGTIDAKENDCYTFDVRDGGNLTIKNGTFTGNISCVYLLNQAGTGVSTCNIEGGTFSIKQLAPDVQDDKYRYLLNCLDASYASNTVKFNVTGGSYVNFNPANNLAEGTETNFCAAGYEAVQSGDIWTVQRAAVAKIDEMVYYSLADAVAAVPADGSETLITMIADESIDVVGYAVTIAANQNVVLDLAGHTVAGQCSTGKTSALIRNLGTLKIEDSTDTNKDGSGNGKLTMSAEPFWVYSEADPGGYASNLIRNEKYLTVESGLLYNSGKGSACYAIDNYGLANLTVNGGKIDVAKSSAIRLFSPNGQSLTVNNGFIGHYNSDDDYSYMGIQLHGGTNANVTIEGGIIVGEYALYTTNSGGSIDISGGTFDGYVGFGSAYKGVISISGGAFNYWVYTWGSQTKFISGGIYAAKENVYTQFIADGCILVDNTDPETMEAYPYAVRQANYICAIGTTKYESLQDAVNAAGTTASTITLLTDAATEGVITGNGVKVEAGQNITFDLNGLTYNVDKTVGSSGTETNGFQLLKGSTVKFTNGTVTSNTAQILLQNYSELTLDGVNVNAGSANYAVSNNFGSLTVTGETNINAKSGGCAFDLWYGMYAVYDDGISVVFDENFTGSVTGKVEYGHHSRVTDENWRDKTKLEIKAGKFDIEFVNSSEDALNGANIKISGGVFKEEPAEEYCAEGYVPTDNTDEETKDQYPYAVMTKEDAGIFEFVDGIVNEKYLTYTTEKDAKSVTYTRSFKGTQANKYQSWFIPFDYKITQNDTNDFQFYKVYMVSYSASAAGGEIDDKTKIYIFLEAVNAGTTLKANKPYMIMPKIDIEVGKKFVFKSENVKIKPAPNDVCHHTETSDTRYNFYGTYIQELHPSKRYEILSMDGGKICWFGPDAWIRPYRWYIKPAVNNSSDDYAKISFVFTEDGNTTSIENMPANVAEEIEGIYSGNGVKQDHLMPGLNIIKYTNGKTKKIYK